MTNALGTDTWDDRAGGSRCRLGGTTRVIDRLGPGDVLGLRGPFGKGWPLQEARYEDVLAITGGIGCAPVTGAIDYMFRRRASYGHLTILHGVKKPVELVHHSRFAAWSREPDTTVLLTADQPDRAWRDRSGVVTDIFEGIAVDAGRTIVFMCGPEVMMRYALPILRACGIPDDRIFLSLERNMHCGVGVCGHCQLGPWFLCTDGPIFSLRQVRPLFGVHGL